ncbi:hypothetical protein PFV29_004191 [Escherichia coli]|nr:hypothetical protein [Escherichia coli]
MFYKNKLIYRAPVSPVLACHTRRNMNSVQHQLLYFEVAGTDVTAYSETPVLSPATTINGTSKRRFYGSGESKT